MLGPFHYAFVQRGALEILLLSVGAGLLGTWIVLRAVAFYSHAVGAAAFPGLVVADGLALPAPLGAGVAAAIFVLGVERLARARRTGTDSATALVLVGALAFGVILASDVFHSGANVETLLFGSLLLIGRSDLALAAAASACALVGGAALGRRWVAVGFDAPTARALGARSALPDAVLLALIALGIVSALAAVGALLATALFVVPAATVRLVAWRLRIWQAGSVVLAALEGVVGLWASVELNVPPGAAVAVVAGGVFALVAAARALPRGPAVAAVAAGALALLAACGSTANKDSVTVVATTTQVGDWTRAIAGGTVTVHQILQPNTDPHEYEPRPADVEATAGAALVLESGGLDQWMGKVVSQAGGDPTVVVLGDRVPVKRPGDPHWWHDPRNAEAAVAQIRDGLAAADGEDAALFRRRAAAYRARVKRLDRAIAACFARVPRAERKLVTDHDAFGYFARRYGIDVVGAVIPSQTTQAQPSARDTARLIALIRHEHVHAVFPESSVNGRLARAIARETGARSDLVLYGDTLGPAGSPGATYLGMERANADAMVRGMTAEHERCAG